MVFFLAVRLKVTVAGIILCKVMCPQDDLRAGAFFRFTRVPFYPDYLDYEQKEFPD